MSSNRVIILLLLENAHMLKIPIFLKRKRKEAKMIEIIKAILTRGGKKVCVLLLKQA